MRTNMALPAGHVLAEKDIAIKSPGGGLAPYYIAELIGRKLQVELPEETMLSLEHLER